MSPGAWGALCACFSCAAATLLLSRAARSAGLGDRGEGARKLQGRPVPPVGGAALLLGTAAGFLAAGAEHGALLRDGAGAPGAGAALAALLLAFLVGLVDDLVPRGLAPARKALLQLVPALVLALSASGAGGEGAGPAVGLLWAALALAAMNAFNTFDNADGAAASTACLALAPGAPLGAAALLGFLPFNVNARPAGDPRSSPSAYLGDSGSHVLGLALLLVPGAWAALLVPAADLARLSLVRVRAGSRPWIGDRRHLAHRLERAGLGRHAVALLLALLSVPAVIGVAAAGPAAPAGCGVTLILFLAALRWSGAPGRGDAPRSG